MDQHPIPQDVTGFQFKLIGTMTVKQFGYVAAGVIMAVIVFYLPLTGLLGILAKVILIPLLGGSGAAIAFVPIEGRPVDVMAGNFFKAAFSPQQYVYRKAGKKFKFSYVDTTKAAQSTAAGVVAAPPVSVAAAKQKEINDKGAKLQALLQSAHNENKSTLDKKEATMLKSLALPTAPKKLPVATTPAASHPAPAAQHPAAVAVKPVLKTLPTPAAPTPVLAAPATSPTSAVNPLQEVTLAQQEKQLQQELQTAQQEETSSHAPAAHQKVVDLQKQLEDVHAQKQKLEQELISLKNQLNSQTPAQPQMMQAGAGAPAAQHAVPAIPKPAAPLNAAPAPVPAPVQPQAPGMPASQYAKTIGQAAPKKADLPHVSDTPNVVVGIVKDPRGNILPNMLVEVKDKDGNPVRAFKTNALGQFASATPLATGVYTIELDDPKKQQRFDVIQITANNQIMLPIEIISHDAREDLRKQLFN